MPVVVHRERGQVPPRVGPRATLRALVAASLVASSALAAQGRPGAAAPRSRPLQGSLERRLAQLMDVPPFARATWGIYAVDDGGRALYKRTADRLFVPASNTKLVVTAAALALLPADYRVRTSLYANGGVAAGVLQGDLVFYGRGDPTFYAGCYGVDTLAPGVCDSTFTALDAIADTLRRKGLRRITGKLVGDGSYFEPTLIHPAWNAFDLNAWYAAPVSGLGFHGNSVDFTIAPGDAVDRPPLITWSPDLGLIGFENRARTGPPDSNSTIEDNFYRRPGTWDIWAEGSVSLARAPWTVSVALPDPNLYAARALAYALQRKGVAIGGGAASTTDSLVYRAARAHGELLGSMPRPPQRGPFPAALPRPGQPGTLLKRLVGTPFESRVLAKTGSIDRVNSLSGYIEQPNGRTITFSVQANARAVPYSQMLAQIDSVIVEIGKTK